MRTERFTLSALLLLMMCVTAGARAASTARLGASTRTSERSTVSSAHALNDADVFRYKYPKKN